MNDSKFFLAQLCSSTLSDPQLKFCGPDFSFILARSIQNYLHFYFILALAEAIIASILIYKPLTNIVVTQKFLLKGEDLCSKKTPSIRAMSPNVTL